MAYSIGGCRGLPLYNFAQLKRSSRVFHDFQAIHHVSIGLILAGLSYFNTSFHKFVLLTNNSPNVNIKKLGPIDQSWERAISKFNARWSDLQNVN